MAKWRTFVPTRRKGGRLTNWWTASVGGAFVFTLLLVPRIAGAGVIITWNWNDGTTQGWLASSTQTNIAGQFQGTNSGNGSLQFFSPDVSNVDLDGLMTVSFDLTITSYSAVSSPSDLSIARLGVFPAFPGPSIGWMLDLSNLAFGQTRSFNLSINDASGPGSLADGAFFSFVFATSDFAPNSSSALLDNFVVSGSTVPELPSLFLLGTALISLWATRRVCHPRVDDPS